MGMKSFEYQGVQLMVDSLLEAVFPLFPHSCVGMHTNFYVRRDNSPILQ